MEVVVKKGDRLWKALVVSWYITVLSAFPKEYLLQVALPIGGHLFLFRVMVPLTALLFFIWLIRRRISPFSGLSRVEQCFFGMVVIMMLYGAASALFALSLGAWFSKFITMGYSFCFTLLFLCLTRDKTVLRNTIIVIVVSMSVCALGSLAEVFCGPFFETPYAGSHLYYLFGVGFHTPFFTFYNTNGLAVSIVWSLIIGALAFLGKWDGLSYTQRRWGTFAMAAAMMLGWFLCRAGASRLACIAWMVLFVSLLMWSLLREKKLLLMLLVVAIFCQFLFIGENYTALRQRFEEPTPPAEEVIPPQQGDPVTPPAQTSPLKPIRPEKNPTAQQSDSIRLNLLLNCADMLMASKGLGIGLGNAELRMRDYGNTGGILDVHCWLAEVFAEFGVFAILPFLVLLAAIFKSWFDRIRSALREKDRAAFSNTLFQFCTAVTFPLLSTANSSSWGIMAMWMYLAMLILTAERRLEPAKADNA